VEKSPRHETCPKRSLSRLDSYAALPDLRAYPMDRSRPHGIAGAGPEVVRLLGDPVMCGTPPNR